jgi:hypothetical protein
MWVECVDCRKNVSIYTSRYTLYSDKVQPGIAYRLNTTSIM